MVLAKYDFDINGKTISNLLEQNEFVYFIPEFYKDPEYKVYKCEFSGFGYHLTKSRELN